eukprot:2752330-Pyramimonas_sp.AAC.1
MRVASCILWRTILANPWRATGNTTTRLEACAKQLRSVMFDWQDASKLQWEDRLGDLTLSTLGGEPPWKTHDDKGIFVGQVMRLKAHETL